MSSEIQKFPNILSGRKLAFFVCHNGVPVAEKPTAETGREAIREIAKTKGLVGELSLLSCMPEAATKRREEMNDDQPQS